MGGHLMIIALAFVLFFFYLKTDKFSPLPPSPIVKGNHTIKSVISQISFPRHFIVRITSESSATIVNGECTQFTLSAPRALFFLDQFSALMSHNTISTRYFYDLQFALLFSHPCSLLLRKITFWGKKKANRYQHQIRFWIFLYRFVLLFKVWLFFFSSVGAQFFLIVGTFILH